jgi:hypothetical protein
MQSTPLIDPAKAVDGNTDGQFFHGSVTHTQLQADPWWEVDLGSTQDIGRIVIWNRTDCCSGRLSNFWVFVSDMPFNAGDTPPDLKGRPGTWSSFQEDLPSPDLEIPAENVRGRYVRIQLVGKTELSLAEVQIYGVLRGARPVPRPPGNPGKTPR